jgi:hypothetical protein
MKNTTKFVYFSFRNKKLVVRFAPNAAHPQVGPCGKEVDRKT